MPFKVNISTKDGKTYKLETESEALIDKTLGENIEGNDVADSLQGYEFKIAGASDKAGLPARAEVPGTALKGLLLSYGKGMWESRPKGLRRRKTVRGKIISKDIVQINLVVVKQGNQSLAEIFPDQNKAKEVAAVPVVA